MCVANDPQALPAALSSAVRQRTRLTGGFLARWCRLTLVSRTLTSSNAKRQERCLLANYSEIVCLRRTHCRARRLSDSSTSACDVPATASTSSARPATLQPDTGAGCTPNTAAAPISAAAGAVVRIVARVGSSAARPTGNRRRSGVWRRYRVSAWQEETGVRACASGRCVCRILRCVQRCR
jgi:hypothetical protein